MDDPTVKIGRYLREAREGRKLSQAAVAEELAERTGGKYLHTTIGKIETGKRGISLIEAGNLADILGLQWDTLLGMIRPSTPETDTDRIGKALRAAEEALDDDVIPSLHTAGNLIKDFTEKYANTTELNEPFVNRVLDSADTDLESVRGLYGWAQQASRTMGELAHDYRRVAYEDDIRLLSQEEEDELMKAVGKRLNRD